MIGDINNEGNNGDNRGKFSDRLKKILRDRLKWRKNNIEQDENVIKKGGRNALKIALALPSVVYTNIKSNVKSGYKDDSLFVLDNYNKKKRLKVNKIADINVKLLKEKKKLLLKKDRCINDKNVDLNKNEIEILSLQKEIVNLIKKRLVKNLNELEVLQSELYVLSELTGERLYLSQCEADIKQIKKLLSKIKTLKEKYDQLKDNIDFEFMLERGDDFLVDKILRLKELCSMDDVRYVVDNYKLLDEYKFLYLDIDKLYHDTIKFDEYKNQEAEKLKKRGIDFEKMKNNIFDVENENIRYNNFVLEQEALLRKLDENVSNISATEKVEYRLIGFDHMLKSSFKYLGLLLLNPLKGLIPSIATNCLITRNMVRNMYKRVHWEVDKKILYEAIDFDKEIKAALSNLDDMSSMINSTLSEIVELKHKYQVEFGKYEQDYPEFRDAISRINKMENAILGNKLKVDLITTRMKEKERKNNIKLKKVKKLNSLENKNVDNSNKS